MLNGFPKELEDGIENAKILLVGAGGIGCEVLKNLVMAGFRDVHVIDLDTIDLSNLNRQFLFQRCHVSQPKSVVACEAARQFCPAAKLVAYHDTIIKSEYGVPFFQQFTMVLNALDNRAARSHVNRMCLAANVPLVESGTAGYLGQVTVIRKGVTECYECEPKAAQKTFPGCTIRNTPSEPIHCIVWAKHLFNQLFGEADPDEDVSPDTADPELAGDEVGSAALVASVGSGGDNTGSSEGTRLHQHHQHQSSSSSSGGGSGGGGGGGSDAALDRVSTRQWAREHNYSCRKLFQKLFCDDIKYLLSMDRLWQQRRAPQPLQYEQLVDLHHRQQQQQQQQQTVSEGAADADAADGTTTTAAAGGVATAAAAAATTAAADAAVESDDGSADQCVWSPQQCCRVLATCVGRLHQRLTAAAAAQLLEDDKQQQQQQQEEEASLVWDKDDDDCMDFVTACANLRAHCFGIALNSRFTIKSMAGNIIPAIATTNAIIAGLLVLEAFKLLESRAQHCRTVYLNRKPTVKNRLLAPCALAKPRANCYVCTSKPEVTVSVNVDVCTAAALESRVLRSALQMTAPDVELTDGRGGVLIISSEPGETDAISERTLSSLGVRHGSRLVCDDFLQNYQLVVNISHDPSLETDDMFQVIRRDNVEPKPDQPQPSTSGVSRPVNNGTADSVSAADAKHQTGDSTVGGAGGTVSSSSGDNQSGVTSSVECSDIVVDDDDDDEDIVCMSDERVGDTNNNNNDNSAPLLSPLRHSAKRSRSPVSAAAAAAPTVVVVVDDDDELELEAQRPTKRFKVSSDTKAVSAPHSTAPTAAAAAAAAAQSDIEVIEL